MALRAAWWMGAASIALVFLLMVYILTLRSLLVYRVKRASRLHERWEPVLVESIEGAPASLPPAPRRRDLFDFLLLWNHLQDSLRAGDAGDKLAATARSMSMDRRALTMLKSRRLKNRLVAIQTLGYLREEAAWDDLAELSRSSDPVVSLSAVRALMRIDCERALTLFLPAAAAREDWSVSAVASILKEAGADAISEPLARAVVLIPRGQVPRMLRFLELAHAQHVAPAMRTLLSGNPDTETVTGCLRIMQDPTDLPLVRELLKSEVWQIRLQAASCLGRIGMQEDVAKLAHACGDQEWWVRYRAAQALASLPFVDAAELRRLSVEHQNEFARDILKQVIAEREVNANA